jgi:DNA invertase Pin-like site-specific DNA recombinase
MITPTHTSPRIGDGGTTTGTDTPLASHHGEAPLALPIRVALYVTDVSANQEQFLRRYADEHLTGSTIVATYRDNGSPNRTRPALRPGMRDALTAAASGAFDVLLIERLTRISRRVDNVMDVVGQLQAASVRLITADEEVDTGAPLGHLVMAMAGVLAEADRADVHAHHQTQRSGADQNL